MALRHRSRDRHDPDDEDDGRRGTHLPLAVAAIALLGLGMWIGRASQPGVEEGAEPQPAPAPVEAAPIDWPGPTDTDNGVPVGYTRTEAGAVAAAVNYDQAWAVTNGGRMGEVLDVVAAQDSREDLRAGMEAGARETIEGLSLDPSDPDFAGRVAYGGYAVDAYSPAAATVRLWAAGHMVDPGMGGLDAGWATTTIELVWERGDWRVSSFRTTDGPTALEANQGDPRRVGRAMNAFEEFSYVPR